MCLYAIWTDRKKERFYTLETQLHQLYLRQGVDSENEMGKQKKDNVIGNNTKYEMKNESSKVSH